MAESKRPESAAVDLDEEAQRRKDRITLLLFLVGAVLIVAGMFFLSKFLSGS